MYRVSCLCLRTICQKIATIFCSLPHLFIHLYHCAELCNPRCISVIKHCEKLSSVFSLSPLGIIILPSIPLVTCDTKWKKNYTLEPLRFLSLSLSLQQTFKEVGGKIIDKKKTINFKLQHSSTQSTSSFPPNYRITNASWATACCTHWADPRALASSIQSSSLFRPQHVL